MMNWINANWKACIVILLALTLGSQIVQTDITKFKFVNQITGRICNMLGPPKDAAGNYTEYFKWTCW